jgi:hypothetical protein
LRDRLIATAIVDRLLRYAVTLNIRANSHRLKEKVKAGLVRAEDKTEVWTGWGRFNSYRWGNLGSS